VTALRARVTRLLSAVSHPQTTVRWRLTLLYGALFLVSGAVLLAVTYTLIDRAPVQVGPANTFVRAAVPAGPAVNGPRTVQVPATLPPGIKRLLRSDAGRNFVRIVGSKQRIADLHQLVIESAIALAVMALISGALGWLVAGRVLRPLRTMTTATRQISEASLHRRLAMEGPPDELRLLADTIDGLLGRLEGAFDAQRRFVANASHELRTPLTAVRALMEMIISDPHATVDSFRATCEQVLEESEQQEQLIDSLLTLAQGERGLEDLQTVDLAAVVGDVVRAREPEAVARGLHLYAALEPAEVLGDGRLIERLAANLADNGLRHNVPSGHVQISVRDRPEGPTLTVANTGPPVPEDQVQRLLRPFQRMSAERIRRPEGLGLGLSIVAAIAASHDAVLEVTPGAAGGLQAEVRFPPATERALQVPTPVPISIKGGPSIGIG
jgi:signal transduction histidine kinase